MNFGPLNSAGGERRLNVLITRARLRCEIFTNMTPDDIDLGRTSARGVETFKRFLAYARTGNLALPGPTGKEPESPFEREVISALESLGYDVVPQVGCAGFFIDIGVKDPDRPERFLIGIECDGATYHRAQTARDRDRLREEALRGMGWRLHRIWCADWMYRYADSVRRLQEAIEGVRQEAIGESAAEADDGDPSTSVVDAEAPLGSEEAPGLRIPVYEEARLRPMGRRDIDDLSAAQLAELVVAVAKTEGPVHCEDVARRIARAISWERVTDRVREAVARGAARASQSGALVVRDDYLWPAGMAEPPLRDRRHLSGKSIHRIAPEEIQVAIRRAVGDSFGLRQEEVARQVGSLLGFDRVTAEMREAIESALQAMRDAGEVERRGEFIQLMRR